MIHTVEYSGCLDAGRAVGCHHDHRHPIALLLPAVQAAREAARLVQCKNNLKQIQPGGVEPRALIGWLPAGGWGCAWVGDPNCGFGRSSPAASSTISPLHGAAAAARPAATAAKQRRQEAMAMQMTQTPITGTSCRPGAGPCSTRSKATIWSNASTPPCRRPGSRRTTRPTADRWPASGIGAEFMGRGRTTCKLARGQPAAPSRT